MKTVRQAAVAGQFYPAIATDLAADINQYLADAQADAQIEDTVASGRFPRAIIVPHAGYIYSAPVAASAFRQLAPYASQIHRVVLLGPSHRVPFYGIATSSADSYQTPLGEIPLDRSAIEKLETLPQVQRMDHAHQWEHSLEVQLPFLQQLLGEFTLVPLVVGEAAASDVASVIDTLWDDENTLFVISSDLSHYHDYVTAQQMDRQTADAIEALDETAITDDGACGRNPVKGLLRAAREHGLRVKTLDLRNSGDTAGPRDQVVGYGAWLFY